VDNYLNSVDNLSFPVDKTLENPWMSASESPRQVSSLWINPSQPCITLAFQRITCGKNGRYFERNVDNCLKTVDNPSNPVDNFLKTDKF
jgi:hypothetical protein